MSRSTSIRRQAIEANRFRRGLIVLAAGALLASCASGGGGGNDAAAPAPALTPPPPAFSAPPLPPIASNDPSNTAEFRTNYGLRSMNAHTAYARGVSGAGVTVAVIDDGIDIDHPDLDDNLSPLSVDIRTGRFQDIDTTETHGTQVAGIIAAERNNVGGHGVAYGAEILAIRAFDTFGAASDVVASIDYARQNGAKILNLSLTVNTLPSSLRQALDRAVADGMLVVLSAGNSLADSASRNSLDALSTYATFASANGQALAVGAIDDENNLFFLSNRPGAAGADVYLLAPGVDIISTTVGGGLYQLNPSSSPNAFGVDLDASGTSFAAPHVAGAAAVLWEMFPSLTAEEVVEILLSTAVDVGVAGVDSVTGHGIVDLGAATQPLGAVTISTSSTSFGTKSLVADTALTSGPAFGDAFAQSNAFDGGLVQDAYRRPYTFDYQSLAYAAAPGASVETMMRQRANTRYATVRAGPNTVMGFTAERQDDVLLSDANSDLAYMSPDQRRDILEYTNIGLFSESVLPGGSVLAIRRGFDGPAFVPSGVGVQSGLLSNVGFTANGFSDLTRGGSGVSWRTRFSPATMINIDYSIRNRPHALRDETVRDAKIELGMSSTIGDAVRVAGAVGQVMEEGAALGLAGAGAFGGVDGASTRYIKLGASFDQAGWSPFAMMEFGATDVDFSGQSLFDEFSTLWSSAFSVGVRRRGALISEDNFLFSVSQPMRVEAGAAQISLPTAIDRDDQVIRTARDLSLTPSAREIALHAAYSTPLGPFHFSGEYLRRANPYHSRLSRAENAFFMAISSAF